MSGVDFGLLMERYGYALLLRLMIALSIGVIVGTLLFWGYFTNGIAAFFVWLYAGVMLLLKRLYEFLFAENPNLLSEKNEGNRQRAKRFFMNRF
ncbi:hypothetical protein [Thermococcus celericrescens]|uniref:hypothetical protein n=1 Tax=Thermococcus celericrescens TaxID=227598 RepID=UPI0012EDB417|nr:hypothetical protein [Thermococcus celericrescens]